KAEGLQQHEANRALVDRKIDAFFYTIGNPWGGGKEVSFSTSVRIIPVDTPGIRKFIADKPYYVLTVIPGGVYRGVGKDVPTYAVKATFVTSNKEPNDVVYNVTKTIFANLDRFRGMHAAFRYLRPKDMLKGLSAPFHPGAVRYYKEKGLM
ncbi:MAG: TAXI family TRAP transporter solute-binding subunit, partial [Nitrospinota bacterium]